jgi:hypothetical protein
MRKILFEYEHSTYIYIKREREVYELIEMEIVGAGKVEIVSTS